MRGLGTIFKQRGSRFLWMQYYVDGKRQRESTGCELLKDAKKVLQETLAKLHEQNTIAAGHSAPATIAGLYSLLDADYSLNGRKSIKHLRGMWRNHLAPYFAEIPTAKLTTHQVETYIVQRKQTGAENGSINRELAALKRMFRIALKAGRLKLVPYIPTLKERNIRKGFLRDAIYVALARETEAVGPWLRAMFELAYTYGWRKGELEPMLVGQIDLAERTIELNVGETKNDEARTIRMTARVFEFLTSAADGKKATDRLFTRKNGKGVGDFRRAWATATRRAGVPDLLFHDLRRTGVRNMRRDGISEKVAMTISGHKTRSVFERYNIVDPEDLREASVKQEKGAVRRMANPEACDTPDGEISPVMANVGEISRLCQP